MRVAGKAYETAASLQPAYWKGVGILDRVESRRWRAAASLLKEMGMLLEIGSFAAARSLFDKSMQTRRAR